MDIQTSLKVLSLTTDALTTPCSLDEALNRITTMAGEIMETEQTAILLRDESRRQFIIRSCTGFPQESGRVGHPLNIPQRLLDILWRIRIIRQIGGIETGITGLTFPLLVVPLKVKGERIGLLITAKPTAGFIKFNDTKRQMFVTIASLASLAIENAKAYDYLRQHFAQNSKDLIEENRRQANGGDETHQLMVSSLSNPTAVVKLLARSFYKELHKAGFSPDHITMATAEILSCITREETLK
ncbi:MAG: GAF domain-containing protein [Lentisphaeria bacterium]